MKPLPAEHEHHVAVHQDCPAKLNGVIYNHISKTGGTAMSHMVARVMTAAGSERVHDDSTPFHNGSYIIQDDLAGVPGFQEYAPWEGHGKLTVLLTNNFFVIGLVRRPCDWLLSSYYEGHKSNPDNSTEFKSWLEEKMNTPADKFGIPATAVRRYGQQHVHCMAYTHTLKEDFQRCMNQYKSCGGTVDDTLLEDEFIDKLLDEATEIARKQQSSVGDHASCDSVFDAELANEVMQHAKIAAYRGDYGLDDQCC